MTTLGGGFLSLPLVDDGVISSPGSTSLIVGVDGDTGMPGVLFPPNEKQVTLHCEESGREGRKDLCWCLTELLPGALVLLAAYNQGIRGHFLLRLLDQTFNTGCLKT